MLKKAENDRRELAQQWFADHVTLFGKPYTLDSDQAHAAADLHKNTLVTARAGSGKTRVIVAKVAYLVAHHLANLDEISIFMFNRTAAAEVNERLAAAEVDGKKLTELDPRVLKTKNYQISIASTFHKFAYDLVKESGEHFELAGEAEQKALIRSSLDVFLAQNHQKLSGCEYQEFLGLVSNFIVRAGQKYPGPSALPELEVAVTDYCQRHQGDPNYAYNIFLHHASLAAYRDYLKNLRAPKTDFNLLLARATQILQECSMLTEKTTSVDRSPQESLNLNGRNLSSLKYIMIDEYQDFSYLFYALICALRDIAPESHLFAVGDDWQAINRFAGSDTDYFLNFAHYFSDDTANIPLATNYRSCRKIVNYANEFMLKNYNPDALPAIAFNHQPGKIRYRSYTRTKINLTDLDEDSLADGRFFRALSSALESEFMTFRKNLPPKKLVPAVKLLKTVFRLVSKHPYSEIMLLHRHNFLSCENIPLSAFFAALRELAISENLLTKEAAEKQLRCLTMHKSKGLESEVVILLEMDQKLVRSHHPHATIYELFGDTLATEKADQERLIYVALTRAKQRLYLLGSDRSPL